MTRLPAQPAAPDRPPLPLAELIEELRIELTPAHWKLAEALLARLDVANVEALLWGRAGLVDRRATIVTGREQLEQRGAGRGELPAFLADFLERHEDGAPGPPAGGEYPYDTLWQLYHDHLAELAEGGDSTFLREWIAWEVPLLNALARWRAGRLGRGSEGALLAEPHGAVAPEALLARLSEEPDPQQQARLLDAARLAAIEERDGNDPFSL
ncbi:MAG: DUF2764 family protein, partial [Deltaproteobacteria bacterium]|nr:DUF2764 family protein [Deltaproteobacteria bacterium]